VLHTRLAPGPDLMGFTRRGPRICVNYSFESYLPSVSLGNIVALSGQSSVQYRAAIKFVSTFLRSSFQHIITQNTVKFLDHCYQW
jgi:hypothetical protein